MRIKILTIPFNNDTGIFEDKDMQDFLSNKKVLMQQSHFFTAGGKPYWTVFVEYDDIFKKENAIPPLSEPERALFDQLQAWRKETAEKEGVPVFIIANNTELSTLAQKAPRTMEGLKQIKGFGNKKTQKYGKELLDMITAFYGRQTINQPKN